MTSIRTSELGQNSVRSQYARYSDKPGDIFGGPVEEYVTLGPEWRGFESSNHPLTSPLLSTAYFTNNKFDWHYAKGY